MNRFISLIHNLLTDKTTYRFLISGCTAVFTDFTSYILLKNVVSIDAAKWISFILGSIAAFVLNKFWTFKVKGFYISEVIKFSILYICTAFINMYVNSFTLNFIWENTIFAFLVATGVSTILNFIGQKYFIFIKRD